MPKPDHAAKTVTQDIFERHENEWRQMQSRETASKPATLAKQA